MAQFPRTNKRRNTALLFEFLIKHISKSIIEDKKDQANKALLISKKFFSEGSPLKSELKLFQSILNTNSSISRESMSKILDYACKTASLMNPRLIDEQKSKLIKEINYTLSKDVYEYKVPEYTNYSSLQLLFNESRSKQKKIDEIDKIKLKDLLISRLLKEPKKINEGLQVNPDYNNTVYKILVNKFHEKYKNRLTENQKKVVIQYTSYMISEDKKAFFDFINKENSRILNILTNLKDKKIKEDKELTKKITECVERYKKDITFKNLTDEKVLLEFLDFIKLTDEIETE